MLLAHAGEDEHVALENRRVGGENGVVLPPPVNRRRRVPARVAPQFNPLWFTLNIVWFLQEPY